MTSVTQGTWTSRFVKLRRAAAVWSGAALVGSVGALACGGAPESKTPEKTKTRMERLERFHERANVIAKELDEMGFGVRPSEVTLLLGQKKQDAKILSEATLYGSRSSSRHALAAFRRLMGLRFGVTASEVFVGAAVGEFIAVPTYYDSVGQYLVFREARIGKFADVDTLVAHGLAHAHQDQAQGGIEAFLNVNSNTLDRARTARAVLEGEASLIASGVEFKRRKRDVRDLDISLEDGGLDYGLADEGSGLIASSGKRFALEQYRRGGWPAVREAYRKPPESSEQLLHPDKYLTDSPHIVTLPAWPDPGALVKQTASDVLGELMLFGTLAHSFGVKDDPVLAGRDEAELATVGWDGDRIDVYELADGDHAALFRSVWDLEDAAADFARVFRKALEKNEADVDKVSIAQRGPVVDVAFSDDPDLLPALAQALAKHAPSYVPNPEDAKTTTLAKEALRQRSRQRPHLEGNYWVHPASGLSVPLPDADWELVLDGGVQILLDDTVEPEAFLFSQRFQDLWAHDLRAFTKYAEASLFSNPRYEQVEVVRRPISGTEVAVVTLRIAKEKDADKSLWNRSWLIPRNGHYFLLNAVAVGGDWDDAQPVFDRIERGLRLVPAD
jgi:hypothetical protein